MATKKKAEVLEEQEEVLEEAKEELDGRAGEIDKYAFDTNAYPFEKVKRNYYKARSGRGSEDIFVCINGKTFLIQRGVEVEIPYPVALVIDNQERMNSLADKFVAELTEKK